MLGFLDRILREWKPPTITFDELACGIIDDLWLAWCLTFSLCPTPELTTEYQLMHYDLRTHSVEIIC
jgi:hypothetical protein